MHQAKSSDLYLSRYKGVTSNKVGSIQRLYQTRPDPGTSTKSDKNQPRQLEQAKSNNLNGSNSVKLTCTTSGIAVIPRGVSNKGREHQLTYRVTRTVALTAP